MGNKVPFSGLKEEDEEEEEEEEEEGFFQKALTLPLSWPLSRRLWLGPQCSKLPLPSCCRQPPPAELPEAGEGWLKSFQRSLRMCFTSKSFRPEPDMLYARNAETAAHAGVGRLASSAGKRRRRRDAPCAPLEAKGAGRLCASAEHEHQPRMAQRSGPVDLGVREPPLGCRGSSGMPGAENPRYPHKDPVVMARRIDPEAENAQGRGSCALWSSRGGHSWIHLTGKHWWQSLSQEGVGALLLAAKSSVPGERTDSKSP
jgi:hypothetical protein